MNCQKNNYKKTGYLILILLVALLGFGGAAAADEEIQPEETPVNEETVTVFTAAELTKYAGEMKAGTIELGGDIAYFEDSITLGSGVTFVSNGHTINLLEKSSITAETPSITATTLQQLKELTGCVIGQGTIKYGGLTYHSVYLKINGSGWINRSDGTTVDSGYIYVKEGGTASINENDVLTVTGVLKINDTSVEEVTYTYTPEPKSGAVFNYWAHTETGDEMQENHPYNVDSNMYLTANFSSTSNASSTIFYYQNFYSSSEIPSGPYIYKGSSSISFHVSSSGVNCITDMVTTPPGIYYLGGSEESASIYLQEAKLTKHNIYVDGEGTVSEVTSGTKVYVEIDYAAAGIYPKLSFKEASGSTYISSLGKDVEEKVAGKLFTFIPDSNHLGVWEIYADFSDYMQSGTEEEKTHVKIGTLDVVSSTSKSATAVLKDASSTIRDGASFNIVVNGPANSRVYVKYYENISGNTYQDDAVPVNESSKIAYYYPEGQSRYFNNKDVAIASGIPESKWKDVGFYTDKDGKVTIGLKANTGSIISESYVIGVTVDGCTSGNPGAEDSPCTITITVTGDTFTAEIEKDYYALGENFKVSGTYTGSGFGLIFYLEGTNTGMVKLNVAKKNNSDLDDYRISGGTYYYVLDGTTTATYNPGTYTLYATKYDAGSGSSGYTIDERKLIAKNAISHTLNIGLSPIEILSIDESIQAGINSDNTSRYLTIKVKAPAAEMISLYIVGQNKMYYINGTEAMKNGYLKNLNASDTSATYVEKGGSYDPYNYNYLFKTESGHVQDNPYYFYSANGFAGASLTSVLQKLGMYVPVSTTAYRWYPNYLIIGGEGSNTDGTFTIYLHMQDAGELTATEVTATDGEKRSVDQTRSEYFADEKENNTAFMDGEYYVVVQHPMADNIFNTEGKTANNDPYATGVNIYTNGVLKFNVPALENINAAQELTKTIVDGNDTYAEHTINVVAVPESNQVIHGPKERYVIGETIEITIDYPDYLSVFATLEENEFELGRTDNINYIKTFTVRETESKGVVVKAKLTLDTSETPAGSYKIVLKGKTTALDTEADDKEYRNIAVYDVVITESTASVEIETPSPSTETTSSSTTTESKPSTTIEYIPDTTKESAKTPAPLLGILAGVGVSAYLSLRRK